MSQNCSFWVELLINEFIILFQGLGVHSNWGKSSLLAAKKSRRQLIFLSLVLNQLVERTQGTAAWALLVATAYKRKSNG